MIDVNDYRENGFILLKGFFPKEEVERIFLEAKEVFALQMRKAGLLESSTPSEAEFEAGMFKLFELDLQTYTNCGKQAQHLISLHRLSLDERIVSALKDLGLEFSNISTRPLLYFNAKRLAKKEVYWRLSRPWALLALLDPPLPGQNACAISSPNSSCSSTSSPRERNQAQTLAQSRSRKSMPLRVADEVDDLRQVDDHQPVARRQDVVRREVAVHDPVLRERRPGRRAPARSTTPASSGSGRVWASRGRRSRPSTVIHSIRISVPSICTG